MHADTDLQASRFQAWSIQAIVAFALLACALPLCACATSLAERTPEEAQLALPGDFGTTDEFLPEGPGAEEPAAGAFADAPPARAPLPVGTDEPAPQPRPSPPPAPAATPVPPETWVPGSGGLSRPPPPDWDPSRDTVVRLLPDGTQVVERLHPDSQPRRPAPVRPVPVQPLPVEAPGASDSVLRVRRTSVTA